MIIYISEYLSKSTLNSYITWFDKSKIKKSHGRLKQNLPEM